LVLEGNKERSILHTSAGRVIEADFDSDTTNLKESRFFVQDNARTLCTMRVKSFVGNGGMMEIIHTPLSPDHF
jgi:hypothetical protein